VARKFMADLANPKRPSKLGNVIRRYAESGA
jgi:hypothetical protein